MVIVQTPLNVEVGFHPIEIAFAFGAFDGLMADLQAGQHGLKGLGGECPAAVGDQGLRDPLVQTGCIEDHQGAPAGLGGCYSCVVLTRQVGAPPHFVRSCLEGPVFDAGRIVWEALAH